MTGLRFIQLAVSSSEEEFAPPGETAGSTHIVVPIELDATGLTGALGQVAWAANVRDAISKLDAHAWALTYLPLPRSTAPFIFETIARQLGPKQDGSRRGQVRSVFFSAEGRAEPDYDPLLALWEAAWHRGPARVPALVIAGPLKGHDAILVGGRFQEWLGTPVLEVLTRWPVVTSQTLASLLGWTESTDTLSYRLRALRELGLVQRFTPTASASEYRQWHEQLTGAALGRRPVRYHRSPLYSLRRVIETSAQLDR